MTTGKEALMTAEHDQDDQATLMPFDLKDALQLTYKDSTISVFIIDRSDSMANEAPAVRDALRTSLRTLLAPVDGREQYTAVVTFADGYRVDLPITHALQIDVETLVDSYVPDGKTLLWRTAYKTIKLFCDAYAKLTPQQRQKLKIFFGLHSDGDDNESDKRKYPALLIDLAQEAASLGLEIFTYGYGIDATVLAAQMGFPTDPIHAKTVTKDRGGIHQAMRDYTDRTTTVAFGRDNRFEGVVDQPDSDPTPTS